MVQEESIFQAADIRAQHIQGAERKPVCLGCREQGVNMAQEAEVGGGVQP